MLAGLAARRAPRRARRAGVPRARRRRPAAARRRPRRPRRVRDAVRRLPARLGRRRVRRRAARRLGVPSAPAWRRCWSRPWSAASWWSTPSASRCWRWSGAPVPRAGPRHGWVFLPGRPRQGGRRRRRRGRASSAGYPLHGGRAARRRSAERRPRRRADARPRGPGAGRAGAATRVCGSSRSPRCWRWRTAPWPPPPAGPSWRSRALTRPSQSRHWSGRCAPGAPPSSWRRAPVLPPSPSSPPRSPAPRTLPAATPAPCSRCRPRAPRRRRARAPDRRRPGTPRSPRSPSSRAPGRTTSRGPRAPPSSTLTLWALWHALATGVPVVATGPWRGVPAGPAAVEVLDRVTVLHAVPAVLADVLAARAAGGLPALRTAVVAGAALPAGLRRRARRPRSAGRGVLRRGGALVRRGRLPGRRRRPASLPRRRARGCATGRSRSARRTSRSATSPPARTRPAVPRRRRLGRGRRPRPARRGRRPRRRRARRRRRCRSAARVVLVATSSACSAPSPACWRSPASAGRTAARAAAGGRGPPRRPPASTPGRSSGACGAAARRGPAGAAPARSGTRWSTHLPRTPAGKADRAGLAARAGATPRLARGAVTGRSAHRPSRAPDVALAAWTRDTPGRRRRPADAGRRPPAAPWPRCDAADLAAPVLAALAGDLPADLDAPVDDVVLGNCCGPGGDVARVAALAAGLGASTSRASPWTGSAARAWRPSALAAALVRAGERRASSSPAAPRARARARRRRRPGRRSRRRAAPRPRHGGRRRTRWPPRPAIEPRAAGRLRRPLARASPSAAARRRRLRRRELVPVGGVGATTGRGHGSTPSGWPGCRPAFAAGRHGHRRQLLRDQRRRRGGRASCPSDAGRRPACPGLARAAPTAAVGVDPALPGLGPVPAIRAVLERGRAAARRRGRGRDHRGLRRRRCWPAPTRSGSTRSAPDADRVCPEGGAIALGPPVGGLRGAARRPAVLPAGAPRGSAGSGVAACAVGGGQGVAVLVEAVRQ